MEISQDVLRGNPGETYTFGMDFTRWISVDDQVTGVGQVTVVDQPEGAQELQIGPVAPADKPNTVGFKIYVPEDAQKGAKYLLKVEAVTLVTGEDGVVNHGVWFEVA